MRRGSVTVRIKTCLSTQAICVTVVMQLEVNSQSLALSVHVMKGLHMSQEPSNLALLEKGMTGCAEAELRAVNNASPKNTIYIRLK